MGTFVTLNCHALYLAAAGILIKFPPWPIFITSYFYNNSFQISISLFFGKIYSSRETDLLPLLVNSKLNLIFSSVESGLFIYS